MEMTRWKIVVDPDKSSQEGSFRVTFRAKDKRVYLSVFVDSIAKKVYVESPIEDPGVRSRLLRHARLL